MPAAASMSAALLRAITVLVLAGSFAPVACRLGGAETSNDVEELVTWMTGVFRSADQARTEPDYFDVQLVMVPIWPERADGPWLYVEQALFESLERPYRQRIYHLVRDGGEVRSDVYELPGDPLDYAGAWRTPKQFGDFGPDALVLREGCSIQLRREGDLYVGSTSGEGCESSLRGAAYATSEVVVAPDRLTSWDRGFDAEGNQVWGAERGPYVFDKRPVAPMSAGG
jgi:CpeT protein